MFMGFYSIELCSSGQGRKDLCIYPVRRRRCIIDVSVLYFRCDAEANNARKPDMKFLFPEWRERLTSTNTALVERLQAGEELPSGFVLAARAQTAGHGRQEREWVSRPGRDLTFSFVLQTGAGFPRLLSLPMAAALGVAAALERFGIRPQTKWPNDLLVEGRKICGILAERGDPAGTRKNAVVVGIGLNVNMQVHEAAAIDRPATSMSVETGQEYAVEGVLEQVLDALPAWIESWERAGFAGLRQAWTARCGNLGERVTVGEDQAPRSGVLEGFGQAGQLLLHEDDGALREVWVGDVDLPRPG